LTGGRPKQTLLGASVLLDPSHPALDAARRRLILDIRGPELLATLPLRPFLVKPNREEIGRTVGRALTTDADLLSAMRELNRCGAEWVVVSAGGNAVFASTAERAMRLQPPRVDVVNPIGCGDCLAAGIACALQEGREAVDAIRFGMAAAAENATQLLPARLDRMRVEYRAAAIVAESIGGE
jgi:fructose-1-phosphate kinase PfkB-like protein